MMRDHIDQNLGCRTDRLPLPFSFIDQRFGFGVQVLRLFDDRSCPMQQIDERLGCWQGLLDLFKLCLVKTGKVADELNEPVFQHCLTSLVASRLLRGRADSLTQPPPNRRWPDEGKVVGGELPERAVNQRPSLISLKN